MQSGLSFKHSVINLVLNARYVLMIFRFFKNMHRSVWERDVVPWYERSLMVRWVVGSILHGVDPLSYFSFQPVLHDWFNKGSGMYYPVCGMMHIKGHCLDIYQTCLYFQTSDSSGGGFVFGGRGLVYLKGGYPLYPG